MFILLLVMMQIKEKNKKEIDEIMQKNFDLNNPMQVPSIGRVVINIGIGNFVIQKTGKEQKKICEQIISDLFLITGQQPFIVKAKKSIANFKTRKGMPAGVRLTLRKKNAFNFLNRLINITLPRSRDFKGISLKAISEEGTLNFGIKEHIIFPEIIFDNVKIYFGFQITIILKNVKEKKQAIKFYKLLGFPVINK